MEDLLTKAFYVACLLGVALFGFWLRYVSRSIGSLFAKHDELKQDSADTKLFMIATNRDLYTKIFMKPK